MKTFLAACAFLIVGCAAVQNADREVNKMTDHGSSHGGHDADGGASPLPGADAGSDSGITSM